MALRTVSADEMRTIQLLSGIAMAIVIGAGVIPPARKYAPNIRKAVFALYLLCGVGFIISILLG